MTAALLALLLSHGPSTVGQCPAGQVVVGLPWFAKPTCAVPTYAQTAGRAADADAAMVSTTATHAIYADAAGASTTALTLAADPANCVTSGWFSAGVAADGSAQGCAQPLAQDWSVITSRPATSTCTSSSSTTCTITGQQSGCLPVCSMTTSVSTTFRAALASTTITCTFGTSGTNTCNCVCF